MKLLIVYGSTEGQTRKICRVIRQQAEEREHAVTINDSALNPSSPEGFDAVILGASVHYGEYQTAIVSYVEEYQSALNEVTSAFISVSMAIASTEQKSKQELKEMTNSFLNKTGWNPTFVEQVAGAIRYSKYNYFKKLVMRMIAKKEGRSTDPSEDQEFTNWNQVGSILEKLEKAVANKEAAVDK